MNVPTHRRDELRPGDPKRSWWSTLNKTRVAWGTCIIGGWLVLSAIVDAWAARRGFPVTLPDHPMRKTWPLVVASAIYFGISALIYRWLGPPDSKRFPWTTDEPED